MAVLHLRPVLLPGGDILQPQHVIGATHDQCRGGAYVPGRPPFQMPRPAEVVLNFVVGTHISHGRMVPILALRGNRGEEAASADERQSAPKEASDADPGATRQAPRNGIRFLARAS